MNAALIVLLVLAIVYVTADGIIKVRASIRRANRPVSDERIARMVLIDPGLDGPDAP